MWQQGFIRLDFFCCCCCWCCCCCRRIFLMLIWCARDYSNACTAFAVAKRTIEDETAAGESSCGHHTSKCRELERERERERARQFSGMLSYSWIHLVSFCTTVHEKTNSMRVSLWARDWIRSTYKTQRQTHTRDLGQASGTFNWGGLRSRIWVILCSYIYIDIHNIVAVLWFNVSLLLSDSEANHFSVVWTKNIFGSLMQNKWVVRCEKLIYVLL